MTSPPNAQRRSEKSHRAVLSAALELSAERGYGNVTVEAIAAHAGVSKKTIYRWWPAKGAVVLEALGARAEASSPFPRTGDIAADLHTQMTAVLDILADPLFGSAYTGLIAETQHDEELARALVEQLIQPRVAAAVDRLRLARQEGQLAPDADLQLITDQLYGPVYYRLLLHLGPYGPDRLGTLIDTVLRPWRPGPPGAGG